MNVDYVCKSKQNKLMAHSANIWGQGLCRARGHRAEWESFQLKQHTVWWAQTAFSVKADPSATRTPGTNSPYNSRHLPTLHHYFPTPPPLWTLSTLKARKESCSSISLANGTERGPKMILHKPSGEWMKAALAVGLRSGMQTGTVSKGSEDPELLTGFSVSPRGTDGVDTVKWGALSPLCGPWGEGQGTNRSVGPTEGQIKASAKLRARFGLKNPVYWTYFY